MQRPNATVHHERASERESERTGGPAAEGAKGKKKEDVPKERSAKGATRVKMVEEMACKRGFVGKRTEPVVRRHLAAPYIFLFLSPLISLPFEQSTPPRPPSSFLLFPSVQHFYLYPRL